MYFFKQIFSAALRSGLFCKYLRQRHALLFILRRAINKNHLIPFIQPIVDSRTGNTVAGEVLMRWKHPVLGNISPECFIPLAEQSGLISRITAYGIQSVANTITSTGFIYRPDTTLFFNVAAKDFDNHDILLACQCFMQQTGLPDLRIGLEITERQAVTGSGLLKELCERLEGLGVHLSLDDFGTGNSNYHYLMLFQPRYIKIDKLFTGGIETDRSKAAIVRNIVAIASELHCLTIAEGVETVSQREVLAAMGVSHFQGYLFSRPVEASVFFHQLMEPLPLR